MIRIDVVIPCAGRVHDLMRLLSSLHECCRASIEKHVVSITVSDDRHSIELADRVNGAFPSVHYVAGPSHGPAVNRNSGTTHGVSDWILFLDDDCYVESDLVGSYANRILANPAVEVFEGAIHPVGERPNGNHHAPLNTTGGHLWSCNLLIKRSVFESVGKFDEQFPFACMEDCDLRDRLMVSGARIMFAGDAVVYHPWRSVSEKEVTRHIISHAIYGEKYPQFAANWGFKHFLRTLRGRLLQYRIGRFSSIPWEKYRTVMFDLVSPLVLFAVMRIAPLRRSLADRHRNRPLGAARST